MLLSVSLPAFCFDLDSRHETSQIFTFQPRENCQSPFTHMHRHKPCNYAFSSKKVNSGPGHHGVVCASVLSRIPGIPNMYGACTVGRGRPLSLGDYLQCQQWSDSTFSAIQTNNICITYVSSFVLTTGLSI